MPKKLVIWITAAVVAAAGLSVFFAVTRPRPAAPSDIHSMDKYVSPINPGHIGPADALSLFKNGALVLDVRSKAGYDDRHVAGAVNVPIDTLADYAAKNLPDKNRVIICYCFCAAGGDAYAAYSQLTALGYTNVSYAEPDDSWAYEGASVTPVPPVKPVHNYVTGAEAKALVDANPAAILLDVRSQAEYVAGHIDGSRLIPVDQLQSRLSELPDKNAMIIVYCRTGVRSGSAYGTLTAAGYTNVYDMKSVFNWPLPLVVK